MTTHQALPMPLVPAAGPTLRTLDRAECEALLGRQVVGRLAFAYQRRIEILPLHYVWADGWLYGRTSPGLKLDSWRHSPWVAFEVDEVRDTFDWTSVVVHGTLQLLAADAPPAEAAAWERGVTLLRRIVPETLTAHDPVSARSQLFRIHADEVTGRAARPPQPS